MCNHFSCIPQILLPYLPPSLPQGWQLRCYGANCFDLLIGLQDISILIPDFYDILELEENSETGSLNSGLDNPNQLPEDKKGKTSFCKIITITNQEVLQVYCIQKLLKIGFE